MTIDAAVAAAVVVVVVVVAAAAAAEVAGIVLAAVARPGEAGSEPVEQVSAKCSALAEDAAVVVVVVGLLAGWHLPTLPGWDSGVEAVAPNPRGSEIH